MSSTADGETCQAVDSTKNAITFSTLLDNKSLTLKALKSFLSRYVQFTQSPHRQDSILKTVQYSLWLLSKFYRNPKTRDALLKLQGEIRWTRYLLRFFGFPAAIDALDMKSSWASGDTSNKLGRIMSWTMIGYYPLEHLSYLFYKAPSIRWLPIVSPLTLQRPNPTATCPKDGRYSSAQLASKASAWSCRFWLAWIVLDIIRCTLELRETRQIEENTSDSNDDTDSKGETEPPKNQRTIAFTPKHMRILRDALYVLPTITWSLPKWDTDPLLSGDAVNAFCWLESVLGLYQGVQDFQKN